MAKLTVKFIENAKHRPKRQEIPDSSYPGLYLILQALPSVVKSWAYRYRIDGRTRKLTLGRLPKIGLAAARTLAGDAELAIRQGRDPGIKAVKPVQKTVEQVCRDFIQIYAKHNNRPKTWHEAARLLGLQPDPHNPGELRLTKTKGEVISRWGNRPIQGIEGDEVVSLINSIFARGSPIAANRALAVIRKMFDWARTQKIRKDSPCTGARPPAKPRKRRHILNDQELRALWRATFKLRDPYGAAYRMLVLSLQRKSQIAQSKLSFFDLHKRIWELPPELEGSKSGIVSLLPITDEIAEIVEKCPHKGPYLFSTTNGQKAISIGSKIKKELDVLMLEELRVEAVSNGEDPNQVKLRPWVNHDLRRSGRTHLSSLPVPDGDIVRELVLGHKKGELHEIYDQYDYLPQKRDALQLWAQRLRDICEPAPANLVQLNAAGARHGER
jgi:hypothetical protein